jgi:hypothetical protein
VAFVAVTVKVDELPGAIEMGLAPMLTAGTGVEIAETLPPHPMSSVARGRLDTSVAEKRVRQMEKRMRFLIKVHL